MIGILNSRRRQWCVDTAEDNQQLLDDFDSSLPGYTDAE